MSCTISTIAATGRHRFHRRKIESAAHRRREGGRGTQCSVRFLPRRSYRNAKLDCRQIIITDELHLPGERFDLIDRFDG
eukprot:SAG11_NODE_26205_length_348_cov_1.032129_1_plen_78_part_10